MKRKTRVCFCSLFLIGAEAPYQRKEVSKTKNKHPSVIIMSDLFLKSQFLLRFKRNQTQ